MTEHIYVRRLVHLPDDLKIARGRRAPELGPKILFFTGGSALRDLSRSLKLYTHNSIHCVTPFDSGGSSAGLRDAFGMLSVGDQRSRLMALADETMRGNPEIYRLFAHRFEGEADQQRLARRVERMVEGTHPLVSPIPDPLRRIVREHLRCFLEHMPASFDLRGASVGNLVLVGGYLSNDRDFDAVLFLFSKLVAVLGVVRPVTDAPLHLAAVLADGSDVIGQHAITGKVAPPIASPIRELRLVSSIDNPEPASVSISEQVSRYIETADLICYPMGSFWTSVVANLLPSGVGRAIRAAGNPKVYVPNIGDDPEELGMSIGDALAVLHRYVSADAGSDTQMGDVVNFVLVDSARADYGDRLDADRIRELGVEIIDVPLVSEASHSLLDPESVAEILISLS